MSQKANTSLIGAFVIGGFVLAITAIMLFGAERFDTRRTQLVLYFEDSINGLDIGSPVKFKGVTIGKVSQVLIRAPGQKEGDNAVPVIVELNNKLLERRGVIDQLSNKEEVGAAVKKGLRAKLQQLSFITGLLYVELDFYPDAPMKAHDGAKDNGMIEIPTAPSQIGTLVRAVQNTLEKLARIDYSAIGERVNSILGRVDAGVAQVDFDRIGKGVTGVTDAAQDLLRDKNIRESAANLSGALEDFKKLSGKLSGQVDPLSAELKKTTEQARATLARIESAAENLRLVTQPGTGLRRELDAAVIQIGDAARSIRSLSDFLERNPSALVTGKVERQDAGAR
jgi:paraquat-inducible protein B